MPRKSTFRDGEGWIWEVVEHAPKRGDDTPMEVRRVLYFLSRYQTRRTEEFPHDWQRRPAADLIDLWRAAVPV